MCILHVRVFIRTSVFLDLLSLVLVGILVVRAIVFILQSSCGCLVLWNSDFSTINDGLKSLLTLLNDVLNRASQATFPSGHRDIVDADIAQNLKVISAHANKDLIGTIGHVLFNILDQVHDHIADDLGGPLEHVVLLGGDVVGHVGFHSVELTRARLIDAGVVNNEHGVTDIGSELAVDVALTLVDQVKHLAAEVAEYSFVIGKLLCEQAKARVASVRERVDFDGFVESAQIVGETFGTCLQNMRKTTLEGLFPAIRKVLVDWLGAVVGVSEFEFANSDSQVLQLCVEVRKTTLSCENALSTDHGLVRSPVQTAHALVCAPTLGRWQSSIGSSVDGSLIVFEDVVAHSLLDLCQGVVHIFL
jgi:hypothetical protein